MKRLVLLLFTSAVQAVIYYRNGTISSEGDPNSIRSYLWEPVNVRDSPDRFNFSGNADVGNARIQGRCGMVLVRSWDIKGLTPSAMPPGELDQKDF